MTNNATDTSNCNTSPDKPEDGAVQRKKPAQTRIQPFSDVLQGDVSVALRNFSFRPWRSVGPLVRYLRRKRFSVNAVLNRALLFYLRVEVGDDWLRDEARLVLLLKEEQRLIRLNRVMLRSGAYLDLYADKVLRGGRAREEAKLGRRPLAAFAPDEEPVFRRMMARREAVVKEIREILARRLPRSEYVLKDERPARRSRSQRCAQNKRKGGEKLGSDT